MYTDRNFRTKKELKEAVARRQTFLESEEFTKNNPGTVGAVILSAQVRRASPVTVFQPNSDLTGASVPRDGKVYLEGPHYPEPHRWYAEAWLKDGEVIRVR